jgi:hypothetical protein
VSARHPVPPLVDYEARLLQARLPPSLLAIRSCPSTSPLQEVLEDRAPQHGLHNVTLRHLLPPTANISFVRIEIRNMTRLVHHHFDYRVDGHQRTYAETFLLSLRSYPHQLCFPRLLFL